MNSYHQLVAEYARLVREGKQLPLGGFPPAPRPAVPADAPKALIFAPHPDDECITGGLALRLLREARFRVVNVAVTQGSNPARQAERLVELQNACAFLGFELIQTRPNGLEHVTARTRAQSRDDWRAMIKIITDILAAQRPRVIFFPHERDWNGTHIGTHFLVADALTTLGPGFDCFTIESEYWGQMDDPNLIVESTMTDVADLVTAVSFHVGEAKRNPFHVLQPAWMLDNVRRGAELVCGQGGPAPDFTFATLYRLRRWQQGRWEKPYAGGRQLAATDVPGALFD
jgi:LmbE family N-acetylglucosaminyl deacetylase